MTLSALKIETADVSFSGGVFAVRGLSLNNIVNVINRNKAEVTDLFTLFANAAPAVDADVIGKLLVNSPKIAAEIIAEGCMEKVTSEVTQMLPAPVQLDALRKIGALTFATQSPKDFAETVANILTQMTGVLS